MSFWKSLFGNQEQLEVARPANETGPIRDEFLAETLVDEEVPQKEIWAGVFSVCFHENRILRERNIAAMKSELARKTIEAIAERNGNLAEITSRLNSAKGLASHTGQISLN